MANVQARGSRFHGGFIPPSLDLAVANCQSSFKNEKEIDSWNYLLTRVESPTTVSATEDEEITTADKSIVPVYTISNGSQFFPAENNRTGVFVNTKEPKAPGMTNGVPKSGRKTDTWSLMFQRLVEYKHKYNTTFVPERCQEDPQLGLWVHSQRQTCKDNFRVNLLNSIGFHWDARTDSWMEMYKRVIEYKNKYNSTLVPRQFKGDPKLGLWVFTQRQCCKKKYRVDLLNAIGFEWTARSDDWMGMYRRLVIYKKEFNTTHVPQSYKKDPKLARWVHNQSRTCKAKDRVDLLNSIGFHWSQDRSNSWNEMYQRLVAYKREHNTTQVLQNPQKGDPQLARWVYYQRQSCKQPDRVDLLNAINFQWKGQRVAREKAKVAPRQNIKVARSA